MGKAVQPAKGKLACPADDQSAVGWWQEFNKLLRLSSLPQRNDPAAQPLRLFRAMPAPLSSTRRSMVGPPSRGRLAAFSISAPVAQRPAPAFMTACWRCVPHNLRVSCGSYCPKCCAAAPHRLTTLNHQRMSPSQCRPSPAAPEFWWRRRLH